jgi:DNA-nicking Smr family endonuclease
MSKRAKTKRGGAKTAGDSAPKREDPFFRPFAKLPAQPAAKQQRETATPTGKAASTGKAQEPPKNAPNPRPAPPASSARLAKRSEPEDEVLTFERFMSGVTPLEAAGARRIPTSVADVGGASSSKHKMLAAQQQEAEQEARARLHSLVEEGSRFEVMDDGRRIEGRRRGVDGSQVRRLRLGELPIDATLDLHGMRVAEAREAVEAFVRDRRIKADHVLVIVHGRGRNSPGGVGVLRGEVAAWLSEGKASTHVAAFVTAPDEHGGEGALCVLLIHQTERARRV